MLTSSRFAVLLSCSLVLACGSTVTAGGPGGGEGGNGANGGGGSGASGGGGVAHREDNEALGTCADDSPCPVGWAQRIEGGSPFSMIDMACVVTAMRDRSPGLYQVELEHAWGNGNELTAVTIWITASGEAEIGAHTTASILGSEDQESYAPTRGCGLRAPSFFDDCLAAIEMGDGSGKVPTEAWECVWPETETTSPEPPWFEGCKDQAPTCE